MAKKTARVSIGLPVYNGERFLAATLESLLAQTYTHFELIISDNASTDRTEEICRAYAAEDERIRYYREEENRGAAWNYNRVFELSRAPYFKWAAADDICLPTFLERCVDVLEGRRDVVLCYPKAQFIDENGSRGADYEDHMHLDHPSAVWRFRMAISSLRRANCVFGVIRTSVLRQTKLIGAYPASDWVLLAELAMHGRFCEVPESLFLRRLHEGMSWYAGKTQRERAFWFQPRQPGGRYFPRWRMAGEYFVAIRRCPLSLCTRFGCYLQLVPWVVRRSKTLCREAASGCLLLARGERTGCQSVNASSGAPSRGSQAVPVARR